MTNFCNQEIASLTSGVGYRDKAKRRMGKMKDMSTAEAPGLHKITPLRASNLLSANKISRCTTSKQSPKNQKAEEVQ